jgi:MoxR-like ATPase
MNPALTHIHDTLQSIKSAIQSEIIGQDELIDKLLISFFAGGHALLEGVPWLGKTKTIRTFARVLGLDTGRVSFTPDLLPSDLTGSEIYRPQKWEFIVRKGPIFTHILLADEINRTPPKVQSALLEAMEEKKVTIGEETFALPSPFVVFATQNPLEHEGTYPLPEAELDRFVMRIILTYPSRQDERQILIQETSVRTPTSTWEPSHIESTPTELLEMIEYITRSIRIDTHIYDYVGDLLESLRGLTRQDSNTPTLQHPQFPLLAYGPSTRAGLALIRCGRVRALMTGRDYMIPEDVKSLAHDILDHRIGLSYEARAEWITPYEITRQVLDTVRIP